MQSDYFRTELIKEYNIGRNTRCPCNRGKKFKVCCGFRDDIIIVKRHQLRRGSAAEVNDNCYLNILGGCSSKITREHLISNAIDLPAAPRELWSPTNAILLNPRPLATTAKVLCKNHNSMLGAEIEPSGLTVHRCISNALAGNDGALTFVNGHTLEAYVLQRLCAYYYAKLLSIQGKPIVGYSIDLDLLDAALSNGNFSEGCGMFIGPAPSHLLGNGFEVSPIVEPAANELIGGRVSMGPIGFHVMLKPSGLANIYHYRPEGLRIINNGKRHFIALAWHSGSNSPTIEVTIGGGSSVPSAKPFTPLNSNATVYEMASLAWKEIVSERKR